MNKLLAVGLAGCLLSADYSQAAPRLHAIFADHAVLQRDTPVPVWGWAEPGEAITVICAGQTHHTAADARGEWTVTLTAMPAGGPFDLTVEGKGRQVVKDLLFGDVWLCGGQSNMEYPLGHVRDAKEELAKADFPQIRMFVPSPYGRDNMPQVNLTGNCRSDLLPRRESRQSRESPSVLPSFPRPRRRLAAGMGPARSSLPLLPGR
jgi:hypothetical protein